MSFLLFSTLVGCSPSLPLSLLPIAMFGLEFTVDEITPKKKNDTIMLIEKIPLWSLVFIYGAFLLFVIISIVGGLFGPQVWTYLPLSSWQCPDNQTYFTHDDCLGSDLSLGETWQGRITGLTKMNQNFRLVAQIQNLYEGQQGVVKDINFTSTMMGKLTNSADYTYIIDQSTHLRTVSCDEASAWCDNVTLIYEPFIEYNDYQITVAISSSEGRLTFMGDVIFIFEFVNEKYTLLELWFRFFFLLVAFLVLTFLTFRLRRFTWHLWTTEQKWTALLLFAVMAYNNPFFPMEILLKGWFFPFLDQLFTVTFIVLLMFYFLVTLDSIRLRAENVSPKFVSHHLVKVILMSAIYVTCVTIWAWIEFHDISDPEYSNASDVPSFNIFYYIFISLAILYIFHLVYIAVRCFIAIKNGGSLRKRISFLLLFTFLVIATAILGIIFNLYGPTKKHASIFLVYLAIFNLYTAILALFYMPFGKFHHHEKLSQEDFKEEEGDIPLDTIGEKEKEIVGLEDLRSDEP